MRNSIISNNDDDDNDDDVDNKDNDDDDDDDNDDDDDTNDDDDKLMIKHPLVSQLKLLILYTDLDTLQLNFRTSPYFNMHVVLC